MSNLKRFLALSIAMLMVISGMSLVSAKSFTDLPETSAYFQAVDRLSNLGIIKGTTDTTYTPDGLVTREQAAILFAKYSTALVNYFGPDASAAAPFADCKDNTYFSAIAQCKSTGIIDGIGDNKFDPTGNITYAQAVKMVITALGYKFPLVDGADWAVNYFAKATEIEILGGFSGKAVNAAMTRGEMALLMDNAIGVPMADTVADSQAVTTADGDIINVPFLRNKTILRDIFKCTQVIGVVEATKNLAFDGVAKANTNKGTQNPITVSGQQFSLAADVDAAALLGKEVSFMTKNGAVVSALTVIGKNVEVASAKFDDADDKAVLTVNDVVYDLKQYSEDRLVYVFDETDGELTKMTGDYSKLKLVNEGFYELTVIDNASKDDVLIFYPMSVGQAKGDRTSGKYVIDTATYEGFAHVNLNGVEAAENDYVLYYANAAAKILKVTAKATKTEGLESTVIYNDHWKAVFGAVTYEVKDNKVTTLNSRARSEAFQPLQRYNIYTVADKVVLTEKYGDATYVPKNYFVLDTMGKIAQNSFNNNSYPVYFVDASANGATPNVTHFNGVALNTPFKFVTGGTDFSFNTTGPQTVTEVVTKDTSDAAKIITAASGDFKFADDEYKTGTANLNLAKETASNLYSATFATGDFKNFTLADYSKVLVKFTDGYVSYAGANSLPTGLFNTTTNPVGYNKITAIFNGASSTIVPTLSFMFVDVNVAKITPPAVGNQFVIMTRTDYSAKSETYTALNPATEEVVTGITLAKDYTSATPTAPEYVRGDIVLVDNNAITGVPSGVAKGLITYSNGYYDFAGKFAINTSTKVWAWNAGDAKYDLKNQDEIGGGKYGYLAINDSNVGLWAVLADNVTIKFDLNGALTGTAPADVSAAIATTITLPTLPAGVTGPTATPDFKGWAIAATATAADAVASPYTVADAITFYAIWEA